MSDTNVFVTISNNKRIPFINKTGPISIPISILRTHAEHLKSMGFSVTEHAVKDVKIDIAGNRVLPHVFAKLPEGQAVETAKNMPAPLVPTPTSISMPEQVVPVTPVAEIIAQEQEEEQASESESSEESTSEETSEEGEEGTVEILSLEAYQKMSVALLRGWLHKHEAYLEADLIAEIDGAKKDRLIEIIDVHFIKAAEQA